MINKLEIRERYLILYGCSIAVREELESYTCKTVEQLTSSNLPIDPIIVVVKISSAFWMIKNLEIRVRYLILYECSIAGREELESYTCNTVEELTRIA